MRFYDMLSPGGRLTINLPYQYSNSHYKDNGNYPYNDYHKNIVRHTAHTIVSWPTWKGLLDIEINTISDGMVWSLEKCVHVLVMWCYFYMYLFRVFVDCFTSHVGEHRTVRGLCKFREFPVFLKIPTMQQSPEEETPFVYVTLATLVTFATAGYTPCLFGYVTIGLARHNRTHFNQSERLLVKPKRPCTKLCAEPVGVWNRLGYLSS